MIWWKGHSKSINIPIKKYEEWFFKWVNQKKWPADHVITQELINEYNTEKKCLIDSSKIRCDILKETYLDWKYEKVALKKRSISQKVWNIWKNWWNLEYIRKKDIKEILYMVLSEALEDFNPKSIARDLKQMYRLLTKWAYDLLADKLVNFLVKKFPIWKAWVIAISFADKLVLKGWQRKKLKSKENTREKKRPRIRILLNNSWKLLKKWHYWWDRTWWWHFPWWHNQDVWYEFLNKEKTRANIFMLKDWQRTLINKNATLFPKSWWLRELNHMRSVLKRKSKRIVMWSLTHVITYKKIKVVMVLESIWQKNWKKYYNLKTLFPQYK